jgi:phage I-like protein
VKKPAFINKVQKIHAGVVRVHAVTADVSQAVDGAYPVDMFLPGVASMAVDDWRVFELTPSNAIAMVKDANEQIVAGKKLRYNYAHDSNGAIAGRIVRAELTQEGGVRAWVQWTDPAQASIRAGEWEGTSPEFLARVVQDEKGNPVEQNGRVLLRPFAVSGGALDNDPAMPSLALAANTESQPERPEEAKEEIMDKKKLAAMLGLPETASVEDVEKKLKAALTPGVLAPCPKCGEACALKGTCAKCGAFTADPEDLNEQQARSAATVHPPGALDKETVSVIAAAVLAQINPKELAKQIREASRADAEASIRAETAEKDCNAAVDAAILAGRVKKSERASALKLAKADVESFKTMTAGMKLVAPVSPLYRPGGTDAEGETAVVPQRHRFDMLGANASAADSADVRDFKEFLRWTAAFEATAGNSKFKNVVEARQAFHAARFSQERTA